MKKLMLLSVLATLAAGGIFGQTEEAGQTWYNSYAPGIEDTKFFINGGIGFGILPHKMSLPPISLSAEYALGLPNLPVSVGAYFGITGYNEELGYYTYEGTMVGLGAKGSYHFNFLKNLDTYASVTVGLLIYTEDVTTTIPATYYSEKKTTTVANDLTTIFYGFSLGARYFFTKNIAAYAEVGYSAVSIVSAGLSLRL
jgi:hypothetical protein